MNKSSRSGLMRLLILGGSTEASALARRLAGRPELDPVLSFARRTRGPAPPPIPFRVGGFGGIAGLGSFLTETKIDAVIDATHPFAARMSRHAAIACQNLGVPLARFTRPGWSRRAGDRWISVPDMDAAVPALGESPRRVFLTIGGSQLRAFAAAPQHHYVVRAIEPPLPIAALPSYRLILARGPFGVTDEISLIRDERIQVLVTKNSGGAATEAKLTAARALEIDVVMIERPPVENVRTFETVDAVCDWIEAHRPAP
jgi:precorrin-6A/cobalt-precorrin-6A reductase